MKKIIWLVDIHLNVHHPAIEKVVYIAEKLRLDVEIIIDDRIPSTERWYWHRLREANTDIDDAHVYVEKLHKEIESQLVASNVSHTITYTRTGDFLSSLSELVVKDALIIFQDNTRIPRHPVFHLAKKFTCNILFLTKSFWRTTPTVAAAVDPLHKNDRPATLDRYIVHVSQDLTAKFGANFDLVHCCYVSPLAQKYKDQISGIHKDAVSAFSKQVSVPPRHIHILKGAPENVLPDWVKDKEIDLLCLGYIARNELQNYLVGGTTQSLLSAPPCDMLMLHQSN